MLIKFDGLPEIIRFTKEERVSFDAWADAVKASAENERIPLGDVKVSLVFSPLGGFRIVAEIDSLSRSNMNPKVIREALDW